MLATTAIALRLRGLCLAAFYSVLRQRAVRGPCLEAALFSRGFPDGPVSCLQAVRTHMSEAFGPSVLHPVGYRPRKITCVWDVQLAAQLPLVPPLANVLPPKVPEHVSYDDFWTRYFFRADKVASGKADGGMPFPPDGTSERKSERRAF